MFRPDWSIDNLASKIPFMTELRSWIYVGFQPASLWGIFFKYHLTDFLWAYSLCWTTVYGGKRLAPRILFAVAFCTFMEVIQIFPFMHATFDWWDILTQLIGVLLASLIYYFQIKQITTE